MRANVTKIGGEYNITSAKRVGGALTKPRTRTIALSDCICYDASGNVIRTIARNASTRKVTRTRTPRQSTVQPTRYDSRRDLILEATMGSIHQ